MTKPRIVYIHGDHVTHWRWGWVATLARDLERAGYPSFFETFPDSIEARAAYWLPFLAEHVGAGPGDVLLGWSCGAVAALRYAQDHAVRGLILIAPYYTDLGLEEVRRSGFVDAPWQWDRIRRNAERIAMFHSDADPYVSQAELARLAAHLEADVHLVRGAGHFGDRDRFDELTAYLLATYP